MELQIVDFDEPCAIRFGEVRGSLLRQSVAVRRMDLLIASVALIHDLTLVTHNTVHFAPVPGLRLVDWLIP